jgi:Rps23 Pro-64 3,4-dihydroxylase Tpa1-like proline 4-hydroxylase
VPWNVAPAGWDTDALAAAWRVARPFPHVILDDLVSLERLDGLRAALAVEPHARFQSEIYDHHASREPMLHPTLRAFTAELGAADALAAVERISGRAVSAIEARSYVYAAGQFLLPHTDCRPESRRAVAFAYYLTPGGGCEGGELELFDCTLEGGQIATAVPSTLVPHRPNRLVLFDVGLASLHQVREVLRGSRLSVAGWYLS